MRIVSVNVNGIRAAAGKGMLEWLDEARPDVVCLQEVRAQDEDVLRILEGWHVLHDPATAKGRAGVAIASRMPSIEHRTDIGLKTFDTKGRWLEADLLLPDERVLTVISAYVHSGEVGTPKQDDKMRFLGSMLKRLPQVRAHTELAVVMGDLNVGHTERDIRNWKGNRRNAGFLPEERSHLDRILGPEGRIVTGADGVRGKGQGWVDVGRAQSGDVDGPYTWWSQRGRAFDTDTGWRIDYQLATPALAQTVTHYEVAKASAWDTRWSDHAPVVVDYAL
ncbi:MULTISPECIES: exodeoxyribonuclease III [unclassified Agrococcus]|uniref:exodeoxyribonuclease III n=1 Tax=unclassified Agrococcus TaxID=2615065 RepID=UPI0036069D3E